MMVATIQHPKLQPVLFQITQQMEHLAGHQPELRQLVEAYQDAKIRRNPLDMALIVRAFLLTINTQIDTRVTNSGNEIVILDGKMRLNRVFNDAQPVSDRFTLRSAPEEHGIVYQLLGARSTVDAAAPLDRVDVYHPLIAQNRPGTAYPVPMTHSRNNPNAVEYIPYTTRALIASLKNSLEKKSTHTVYSVPRSVNIHEAQAQFRLPTDPKPVPAHRYAHYRHWSDLTVTRT
ncbi:hypothetical protein EBR57_04565 [bacterium]|nr:hypothetical protein [bacterium]